MESNNINLIIIDDHNMIASGIAAQLNDENGINVIGVITEPAQLITELKEKKPNAVLMDIRMGKYNGLELAKEIRREYPKIKIILMSEIGRAHV